MKDILRLVFMICCFSATAQTKHLIAGRIIDEQRQGLPMVSIAVEKTTSGTYSDEQGNYQLSLPDGGL